MIMKTTFCLVLACLALVFSLHAVSPEDPDPFTQAELAQMLAPIALYPDTLLAQILMASTYPLEVVEAARWSRSQARPEGEEAVAAVSGRDWDLSVKALVAFPQILERMDEDLEWTRRLGDAFLLQEEQVMDAVQGLRQRAYAAGNLESLEHVQVVREREVIVIQPANPRVVYVPYYHPTVIYGAWWWPAYPPYYWRSSTIVYPYYGTSIVWSSGVRVSTVFFYCRPDWHRRHLVIVDLHRPPVRVRDSSGQVYTRYVGGERWRHEPAHRRGVAYRNESLHQRYERSTASGVQAPESWRDREVSRRATSQTIRERQQISPGRPMAVDRDRFQRPIRMTERPSAAASVRSRELEEARRSSRSLSRVQTHPDHQPQGQSQAPRGIPQRSGSEWGAGVRNRSVEERRGSSELRTVEARESRATGAEARERSPDRISRDRPESGLSRRSVDARRAPQGERDQSEIRRAEGEGRRFEGRANAAERTGSRGGRAER